MLSSKDVLPPAAAAKAPTVGYDVEFERMRLEFEMKKFEAEEARRREEREVEEARWRQERELQQQELHIRRDQWAWQKQRDVREGEKQKTPAAQEQFFGDV